MAKLINGIIPPMSTPFKDNEDLDLEGLKSNIARWNQTGLAGYLVVGSNGESVFLDDAERDAVISATVEAAAEGKLVMAGTGAESTRATILWTKRAAELGAHCALVMTPNYFKSQMKPARLKAHYLDVAEAATIPILLYNFPQATGLNMEPELVAELAAHPNIAGIKDSSGNMAQMGRMVSLCPEDFSLIVGNAETCFAARCLGAAGAILAVANVLPDLCVEIWDKVPAGEIDRAREIQLQIIRLAALVTRIHGVGGLKEAMRIGGYVAGSVRRPLGAPDQAARQEIAAEMAKLGY